MLNRLTRQFAVPRLSDILLGLHALENYVLYHFSQLQPDFSSMKSNYILAPSFMELPESDESLRTAPTSIDALSITHNRGHAVCTFSYDKQWIESGKRKTLIPICNCMMTRAFEHSA
jgi:hypothetical protein